MLWICLACTTGYSVGAQGCPHCGSAEYAEEGTEMPKISRHGGPSYKIVGEPGPELLELPPGTPVEMLLPDEPVDVTGFATGGIVSSGGPVVIGESADGTEPELVSPYVWMLRADLQELCRVRGLTTSGNKDELVARLIADDAVTAAQDSESA